LYGAHFLLCDKSSIHDERCAGGKSCIVGTEIENRCGDLFAGAYPPDRDKGLDGIEHLAVLSGKAIEHLGCNGARGDGIDADVLFGELEGESLGEASTACLDAVMMLPWPMPT
jgi:hypothetical protein